MPINFRPIPEMPIAKEDYFFSRSEEVDGCWEWTGARCADGYGICGVNRECFLAHRVAYAINYGIQEFGEIDHLCRNRACIRPSHLEVVPHIVNVRRGIQPTHAGDYNRNKTFCKHGHALTEDNVYRVKGRVPGSVWRICRTCRPIRCRLGRQRRQQAKMEVI